MAAKHVAPLALLVALSALGCTDEPSSSAGATPGSTSSTETAATTTTVEPTTTTAPQRSAVVFSYAYEPPNGNVDDWAERLGVVPPDPASLGRVDIHGELRYAGDVAGAGTYVLAAAEHPGGFATMGIHGVSMSVLSGSVADCGQGTAVVVTTYVAAPLGEPTTGTWQILPGYGTGDLTGLVGSGTSDDELGPESGSGTMTGTVACDGVDDTDLPPGGVARFTESWGPDELVVDPTGTTPLEQGLAHGHGTTHLSGALEGTGREVWVAVDHPDGGTAATASIALIQFAGWVRECGEGTMLLELTSRAGSPPSWRIVDGHGTGNLAGAAGSGRGYVTADDLTAAHGVLDLSGSLECRPDVVQPEPRASGFTDVIGAVQPDGSGGLWAAVDADGAEYRIEHRDAAGTLLVSISPGRSFSDMGILPFAAGDDAVLAGRWTPAGSLETVVYDADTGVERGRFGDLSDKLAIGAGRGFVLAGDQLVAVSPDDGSVVGRLTLPRSGDSIGFADGSVWVGALDHVWRIDPRRLEIVATVPANGQELLVGDGAVWAVNGWTREVLRIDPRTDAVTGSLQLEVDGFPPTEFAVGGGAVWRLTYSSLQMVSLTDERAVLPFEPRGMAGDADGIWLTGSDGLVYWLDPAAMTAGSR